MNDGLGDGTKQIQNTSSRPNQFKNTLRRQRHCHQFRQWH